MPKTNRIRRAVANRLAFGRRPIYPQTAAGFDRAYGRYMNMGVGIRRLAGTIITNRLGKYYRRNR